MLNNLVIKVKPDILNIFKVSQAVSIVNEMFHYFTREAKNSKDIIEITILKEERKEIDKREDDFRSETEILKNMHSKLEDIER